MNFDFRQEVIETRGSANKNASLLRISNRCSQFDCKTRYAWILNREKFLLIKLIKKTKHLDRIGRIVIIYLNLIYISRYVYRLTLEQKVKNNKNKNRNQFSFHLFFKKKTFSRRKNHLVQFEVYLLSFETCR